MLIIDVRVTGNVEIKAMLSNFVIAGNPARIVNTIDNYIKKMIPYNLHCKHMPDNEKKEYLMNQSSDKFIKVTSYLKTSNESSLSDL